MTFDALGQCRIGAFCNLVVFHPTDAMLGTAPQQQGLPLLAAGESVPSMVLQPGAMLPNQGAMLSSQGAMLPQQQMGPLGGIMAAQPPPQESSPPLTQQNTIVSRHFAVSQHVPSFSRSVLAFIHGISTFARLEVRVLDSLMIGALCLYSIGVRRDCTLAGYPCM